MALRAVKSRSLGDQIFEQLGSEIITGRYAPDDTLPPERMLVDVFEVNRHVVREALKRLEQVGLVRIAQGGRTTVRDFKRHAGLDLLELMADHARSGHDVSGLWLAVEEMRVAIGADVARLCAIRADADARARLLGIARDIRDAERDREIFELELRFWDQALEGAGNIAYRLAFNSFARAISCVSDAAVLLTAQELRGSDSRLRIAQAIADGEPDRAEAMTRELLRPRVEHFEERVAQLGRAPATRTSA